jgi:hypothetical protein
MQTASPNNAIYKDKLAYSSGSNHPTRELPEYFLRSKDPAAYARYDVHMAKAAGIDAFCFGDTSYGDHTQFSDVFWAYWKAAQEDGAFKMVPFTLTLSKENGDAARWERSVNTWNILDKDYVNTFLQIDGKYVVHDWTADPRKGHFISDDEMNSLFDPFGGLDKVYLISQTTYLGAWTPTDGVDGPQYSTRAIQQFKATVKKYASGMTQFQADAYGDLPATENALAQVTKELGKELIYPAMASFYQSRWQFDITPWPGGRIREKLGIAGYYYQWRRAIDANARIVYITTWNDETEDHSIMPEELHSFAYYELTKYFIKWFNNGTRPPVEQEKILLFHHPQLTEKPLQVPPGGIIAGRYNNSATPPTDYIGVVVMLKSPAKVTVELGVSSTGIPNTPLASRDFPAGTNFWLIYHPLTNGAQSAITDMDPNKKNSKDDHPVYPEEQDDFFITKLNQGFEDREVFVSVDRDNKTVGYFTSHQAIVGAAAAGNLGTVGDVFDLE